MKGNDGGGGCDKDGVSGVCGGDGVLPYTPCTMKGLWVGEGRAG